MRRVVILLAALLTVGLGTQAQTQDRAQSLADIRSELATLNGMILGLRQELSQTGTSQVPVNTSLPMLQRLDLLEAEMRRLTGSVETLSFRIERVVSDATNRIGDLEFRLVELEGGDLNQLGQTPPLGGQVTPVPVAPLETATTGPQVAISETTLFETAFARFKAGDYPDATQQFRNFVQDYPAGPLTGQAQYYLGEALFAQQDWNGAARSFLDSFSGAPNGELAADALYRLGISLGQLGQFSEACLTLTEVPRRYPTSPRAAEVPGQKSVLGCS
ncbi:MAG: tol-pal system protein YbgF [Pseudomonadota bacterium]